MNARCVVANVRGVSPSSGIAATMDRFASRLPHARRRRMVHINTTHRCVAPDGRCRLIATVTSDPPAAEDRTISIALRLLTAGSCKKVSVTARPLPTHARSAHHAIAET